VLVQAQQVVGQGRIVTGPKSEAGQRTVSLPRIVVEALEKHLANYGQPGEAGVLFTGPRGEPITRALLSKEWQAARTAADAPEGLRIHDLRHHAATLTARMPGITTKELMARIGHASPRAALIYQHATEQRDREIAAYLDDAISPNHDDRQPVRCRDLRAQPPRVASSLSPTLSSTDPTG
jgi:integrase